MDLKEKQLEIIKHYGMDKQLDLLIEECAELIVAVRKFKRSKMNKDGFEMEYSLVEELKPNLAALIDSIKDNKTSRQMHRIEKEGRTDEHE